MRNTAGQRPSDPRTGGASRLVMAGVDLGTVQELGGWKTLTKVNGTLTSHQATSQAAVERLVPPGAVELARN